MKDWYCVVCKSGPFGDETDNPRCISCDAGRSSLVHSLPTWTPERVREEFIKEDQRTFELFPDLDKIAAALEERERCSQESMDLYRRVRERADKLQGENARLRKRVEELEQWQRDMVKKAADASLEGYREMGDQLAAKDAEIERLSKWDDVWRDRVDQAERERDELRAARIAYANEFPLDANGEPDVGNIHTSIRALRQRAERAEKELENQHRLKERYCKGFFTVAKALGLDSAILETKDVVAEIQRLTGQWDDVVATLDNFDPGDWPHDDMDRIHHCASETVRLAGLVGRLSKAIQRVLNSEHSKLTSIARADLKSVLRDAEGVGGE